MDDAVRNWAAVCGAHAVFVGITSRVDFDSIALPVAEYRASNPVRSVLTKSVEQAGVMVVMQHWLEDSGGPGHG